MFADIVPESPRLSKTPIIKPCGHIRYFCDVDIGGNDNFPHPLFVFFQTVLDVPGLAIIFLVVKYGGVIDGLSEFILQLFCEAVAIVDQLVGLNLGIWPKSEGVG